MSDQSVTLRVQGSELRSKGLAVEVYVQHKRDPAAQQQLTGRAFSTQQLQTPQQQRRAAEAATAATAAVAAAAANPGKQQQ